MSQVVHAGWPHPMQNRVARGVVVTAPPAEMANGVTRAAEEV
jgi:hypothetical protein